MPDATKEKKVKQMVSEEYRRFQEEEASHAVPQTLYEKLCHSAAKIIKIEADKKSGKKLQEAIDFAHLHITPSQVSSLTILFVLVVSLPTFVLMIMGAVGGLLAQPGQPPALPGIDLSMGLFAFMTVIPVAYYIYLYPLHLKKRYQMNVGSDMVSAILYMVVYMRNIPNLEGAVDFAARNLTGPMANELRKLMWDVRVGNFLSVEEALLDYAHKWKENKEFVESTELLITSTKQGGDRGLAMMDEAVRVMLQGNRESARHYVQQLKLPIAVIHAMGLILPVMGLVLFPIIAIFLAVSAVQLFLVYDIALPLILFFFISRALETRPATYSKIDIAQHPDVPPEGKFFAGKGKARHAVAARPIGIAVSAVIIALALVVLASSQACSISPETGKEVCIDRAILGSAERPVLTFQIASAILMTFGITLGPAVYFMLLSRDRVGIRRKVQRIEAEFKEALFQLGNTISGGTPIETALTQAVRRMEEMKIRDMFSRAAYNMQRFNMTFEQAFFDRQSGAITFYPSVLIRSVMRAVVESTKKGVRTASAAMLAISKYLRGLHDTQEQVNSSLSDVTNSLKFQAYALSPLISGVIATMAVLIIKILQDLSAKTAQLGTATVSGLTPITAANLNITPFQFIFVVSVFLVESLYLLAFLMSGIESGEDPIGRNELTGYVLLIGTITYAITLVGTVLIFSPLATAVT
jgi:Flp pilus assembly protein TadB